jgi:Tol biopolymer transport system component
MEVSPNGTNLAFAAAAQGKPIQIFIRSLDAVEAHAVPGTEGAVSPFWSPDGRFVAFFADGQLKKVDITGGPVQPLCSLPGAGGSGLGGTWNRAGVIVFGVIVFGSQSAGGLYRTPDEPGGRPTQLTSIDAARGELAHLMPQFLPDGNHFLYVVKASKVETSGLYAAALDSKQTKRILEVLGKAEFVPPDHLLLMRGGALFHQSFSPDKLELSGEATRIVENVPINEASGTAGFSVAPNVLVHGYGQVMIENSDLGWYDRTGKLLMHVGTASYMGIDLWKDKRLAAHYHNAATGGGDIWITTNLERETPTRFTFDASEDSSSPIWSPDGTSVAFSAVRNGRFGLYRKASSGVGREERLFESETPTAPMSWSPDGTSLVFVNYDPKTQADLWILPLFGDRKPIVYLKSPVSEAQAQISPDGHWIAYSQGVSFATRNIWIESYPNPGTKWQVSTNGGTAPRWRADGKELFYAAADRVASGRALWSVAVESNGPGLTFGSAKYLFDSRSPPVAHATWGSMDYFFYAVSPDGQKILIPRSRSTTDSADQPQSLTVTVVLNWTTTLLKK